MELRSWYAVCFFFGIYNLKILLDDLYSISYYIVERENDLYDSVSNFSVCTNFDEIKKKDNRTIVPKLQVVNVESFINHSIASIECNLKSTGLFKLNESYLFNGVCFMINKSDLEHKLREFIKRYKVYLFIFSYSKSPFFYEYVHLKINHYDTILLKIHKRKIFDRQFLISDCSNYKDQMDLNRFRCLNKCFKDIEKSVKNYYSYQDDGQFNLSLIISTGKNRTNDKVVDDKVDAKRRKLSNNLVESYDLLKNVNKKYETCLGLCVNRECYWETYNVVKIRRFYFEKFLNTSMAEHISVETTIYLAYYVMADFWLQLAGLVTLFTGECRLSIWTDLKLFTNLQFLGTSLISVTFSLMKKLVNKLEQKYRKPFEGVLPKINFALIIFGLIVLFHQSREMLKDYKHKLIYPNKTSISNFSSELMPISLVICFPIELLILNDSEIVKGRNMDILRTKNFYELEKATNNGLRKEIREMFLSIGSKMQHFHYSKSKKVLFKNTTFSNTIHVTSRCFRIEILINQMRHISMIPISNLVILFRNRFWEVFLLEQSQNFSSRLESFKGEYKIGIKSVISSSKSKKSNCVDYSKLYSANNGPESNELGLNCDSRQNCYDQCVNKKTYLEKNRHLSTKTVLDKDEFDNSIDNCFFDLNDTNDPEIEQYCSKRFNATDCSLTYFYEVFKTTFSYEDYAISINLNFEKSTLKDIEHSFIKVIFNIANLQGVLFGTNIVSLGLTVFSSFKRAFRLQSHTYHRVVIFSICSIGFLAHNYYIFRDIVHGQLVDNEYFEKLESFTLPNTIFCFNFSEKLDENYQITGEYLDKISSDLSYEIIFDKILYFNKTHLNTFKPTHSVRENTEISFTHFYYFNMKCFEIEFRLEFEEKDFYFTDGKYITAISFNKTFANQVKIVYFIFKYKNLKQFSGIFRYKVGNLEKRPKDFRKYDIIFELFEIEKIDRFELLKNPMKLFYRPNNINDPTSYLNNLIEVFNKRYNLSTREIILENVDNNFKLEINDVLFQQFYLQFQNETDRNYASSTNLNLMLYNIYNQENFNDEEGATFNYAISLGSRQVLITNEDNYTRLVQTILNTLSLWLNVCVLDLFVYVNKLINYINIFHLYLIDLKLAIKPRF